MAMTMDEILAAGGYNPPPEGWSVADWSHAGWDPQFLQGLGWSGDPFVVTRRDPSGEGDHTLGIDPRLQQLMASRGYRPVQRGYERALVDAQGNFVPGSQIQAGGDTRFFNIAAAALAGVGTYAAAGGAGAGTAAGAAEGGGATLTAEQAAFLEANAGAGAPMSGMGGAGGAGGATAGAGAGSVPTSGGGGGSTPPPSGGGSTGNWWDQLLSSLGNGTSNMGLRDWLSIASGIYGLNLASNARDEMDPFRSRRPYFADRLMELEANPSLITQRPGYRAGLDAINAEMAARGYFGSGNHAVGLSRFSGDFYNQEAQRLAGLAGAGAVPGAGMGAYMNLTNQSLGSIGYGLAPYGSARPRVSTGGSYYGGGYTNPTFDPAGQNQGG